jgi:F-type H+-transporting ATPase subunit b
MSLPSDAAQAAVKIPFPPLQVETFANQLFWLAICFAVLYWIVSSFIAPRVGSVLEKRHDTLMRDRKQAVKARDKANETLMAYTATLNDAKTKARDAVANAKAEAQVRLEAQRKEADAALAEKVAQAQVKLQAIRAESVKHVETIANDNTRLIVQQLLAQDIAPNVVANEVTRVLRGNA